MRILVVEDEPKIAGSLAKGLKAEKYVVDIAENSDQAEVLAGNVDYDLVLMDWMIPGNRDGAELVRYWRGQDYPAAILMLTAKSSIGDRVQGLDSGADDYLPKPFAFDELLARVRSLLRRPKQHKGTQLKAGKLSLNTLNKRMSYDNQQIGLTGKEFQVMEYLVRRKGEIVTKDDLLNHVWSDEERVQYNTVETFIANIRKKLGSKASSCISTRRGYGYIIE